MKKCVVNIFEEELQNFLGFSNFEPNNIFINNYFFIEQNYYRELD